MFNTNQLISPKIYLPDILRYCWNLRFPEISFQVVYQKPYKKGKSLIQAYSMQGSYFVHKGKG